MTPESRNSPLLDNGSLTYFSMEMRIRGNDLVRNALSMSTESTNNFHGDAIGYVRNRVEKNEFSLKIYVRLASSPQQTNYWKKSFWKYSKNTLKKEACLTQARLVSVHVTARRYDERGSRDS
jgi:hypothetical protein